MHNTKSTYILVCGGDTARFYKKAGVTFEHAFTTDFIHPETRLQDRSGDAPGRVFESATYGKHAYEPRTDPHALQRHIFAQQLADLLETSYEKHEFSALIVIASPALLGELRKNLSPKVLQVIQEELPKDISHFPEREIHTYLTKELGPP